MKYLAIVLFYLSSFAQGTTDTLLFEDIACDFIDCLTKPLDIIATDGPPVSWDNEVIEKGVLKAQSKLTISQIVMDVDGTAVVAADRVRQAMKGIEDARDEAEVIGDKDARTFLNRVGRRSTTCSIELVKDLRDDEALSEIVSDPQIRAEAQALLVEAKDLKDENEWYDSAVKSLTAVRTYLNAYGSKIITACQDQAEVL